MMGALELALGWKGTVAVCVPPFGIISAVKISPVVVWEDRVWCRMAQMQCVSSLVEQIFGAISCCSF